MKKTISGSVLKVASVATVISDHFLQCKLCGNDISLMGQKRGNAITRFLQCTSCNIVMNLPMKGELTVLPFACPVCRQTFVGKVMSLLFNILSRLIITFLPRSKRFWISWLQSLSAVILEPKKIKSDTVSAVSSSISHEVMGPDTMMFVFWI